MMPAKDPLPKLRGEETPMAKAIRCRDVGVDCDFEATSETVDDLMRQCAAHAKSAHGMDQIPPELAAKVQSAIRDV
jgi:predicted small metal-binding protein